MSGPTFRHPPLFSHMTALAGGAALARRTGQGRRFVSAVLGAAHSKRRKERVFADYEPIPEDLFVATYPKSGTNWALQLALQTAWRGRAEFAHVHEAAPWPESPFPGIVPLDDDAWRAAPHPVHVIKTAFELRYLPVDSPARFLGVLRDPKDVAVSSYHFLLGFLGLTDTVGPDQWIDWFTSEDWPFAPWADHAADLWAARDRDNVELLVYGDMKRDLPGALARVEALLGVDLGPDRDQVLERSGFAWMKAHEHRFGPPQLRFRGAAPPTRMMRSGKAGGSSDLLTSEQQQRIDAHARDRLRVLGSDLPYDELFSSRPARGP